MLHLIVEPGGTFGVGDDLVSRL